MKKKKPAPAPVDATTFWLELDEQDVWMLNAGRVPQHVLDATDSFLAWMQGPAEGLKHDAAARLSRTMDPPDAVAAVAREGK